MSFEPISQERVIDNKSRLGKLYFLGSECEVVMASKSPKDTDKIWLDLKRYFDRQIALSTYDVRPNGAGKNGHIVSRGALLSVGLRAKMDLGINAESYGAEIK